MGSDRGDDTPRPSPQTFRQPTAYLAEVTSLSPGLPPQRLPGVREPQHDLNPESGSFRRGLAQGSIRNHQTGSGKQSLQNRGLVEDGNLG